MQKRKRMISMVLAGALFVAAIPAGRIDVQAEELVKAYIVKTESATECAVISECYMEGIEAEPADGGAEGLLEERGIFKVELTLAEAQALEQEEGVVGVEEDIVLKGCGQTGENLGQAQWNLEAIHKGTAQMGDADVKVALVDSGVAQTEDIDVAESISFLAEGEADGIGDTNGHGTAMAGMIAAKDNGIGITGVAPGVSLYSLQVLDSSNHCTLSQLLSAIYWACENGMDIINLSLGTEVDSSLLHQAVADAKAKGCLVVAAGGNMESTDVLYPAAYDEVLATGATDTNGELVTGYGAGDTLDILAPGLGVPTTGLPEGVITVDGTSISAAQVTGAAALIWSRDKNKDEGFVRSLLEFTVEPVEQAGECGAGRLDIEKALQSYEEYALSYKGEETEPDFGGMEPGMEPEEEEELLFDGLWAAERHSKLVTELTEGIISFKPGIEMIRVAAKEADTIYGTSKENACPALHGVGNYVLYLKYLFYVAKDLRAGKTFATASQNAYSRIPDELRKSNRLKKLEACTSDLLSRKILSKEWQVTEETNYQKYCKVLGFALHLIGDTYAHRTIVPRYTVEGANPEKAKLGEQSMFGYENFKNSDSHTRVSNNILKAWAGDSGKYEYEDYIDQNGKKQGKICKYWNCFQKTVFLGVMEFRDIKHYMSTTTGRTGIYEDNIDFCPERFKETKRACRQFLEKIHAKEDFTYQFFWSKYKNVLNNYKGFCELAGETIKGTDAEWSKVSTLNEV